MRLVAEFEEARGEDVSQRQFAKQRSVPRTTLQGWLQCGKSIDESPRVVEFFESPEGLAFLHRLVVTAHLVFGQQGACGRRLLSEFLRGSHLDRFVASSLGSQHKFACAMEEQIRAYADQQRVALGATMAPKKICVCEDETFHPQLCLVAIEPVSNFILVERYAKQRDAQTWREALEEGLCGLPVVPNQLTGDGAKGLICHAQTMLNVHYGPDLFHGQQEISRGTAIALEAKITQAETAYDEASLAHQQRLMDQEEAALRPRKPGRPVDFQARSAAAEATLAQQQRALDKARTHRATMKDLVRSLGLVYHPFDLATGVSQSADQVGTLLANLFYRIRALAKTAQLSEGALKHIDKAQRLLLSMVATIAFFHTLVAQRIAALSLSEPVAHLVHKVLLPGLYLQTVAKKLPTAARRHALNQQAQSLLATLQASAAWTSLDLGVQQDLRRHALECALLFQRSTSCVEGRNGYLALRHHQLRLLSTVKLAVLTALHNYRSKRADGTTAAERFFGAKPDDLLDTLCARLALPARPRKRRPPAPREVLPIAA